MIKYQRIALLAAFMLLITLLLAACTGSAGVQGPQGAQGPQGPSGEQGPPGIIGEEVASIPLRPEAPALTIELASPGHWHVTRSKTLNFTVTDANANPITGLKPTVTIKTLAGSIDVLRAEAGQVVDNGDGTYSTDYIATDLGSGYASAYSIAISLEHSGERFFNAWPAEVVRDGNERIMPTVNGTMYAYQVRYAWDPGTIEPGQEVTMYFEPRRAIQTGDQLDTQRPWRNTFNNLPNLENVSVPVESAEGVVLQTLTPTYSGLGVYQARYTPASAGEYKVSFLFTDPDNGFTIDKSETFYPLTVTGQEHEEIEEGHTLFQSVGCSACHGAAGEGTAIGPGIAGHSAEEVTAKVRNSVGAMPPFSEEALSDEDLSKIIAFIESLGPANEEHESHESAEAADAVHIDLASPGHWHVTRSKTLNFTVTDANANPITGLKPTITIKTLAGSIDVLRAEAGQVVDNGDGTYSADYIATDLGSGYASAYSIAISVEHSGERFFNAWPAEVVRDGNERIMPTVNGTMYAYQVRYAWDPGTIEPGQEVTMYFEPRRAIQTGDRLNTQQPWRNTFNNLPNLDNVSVLVESAEGVALQTLTPTYSGLGIYQARYTPASAGEYKVSFLFTDPDNGFAIDKSETSYPLTVTAVAEQKLTVIMGEGEIIGESPEGKELIFGEFHRWEPSVLTVNRGDRVTLTVINPRKHAHSLVLPAFGVDSGPLAPRGGTATVEFTATVSGVFPFLCGIPYNEPEGMCDPDHKRMVGYLTVLER